MSQFSATRLKAILSSSPILKLSVITSPPRPAIEKAKSDPPSENIIVKLNDVNGLPVIDAPVGDTCATISLIAPSIAMRTETSELGSPKRRFFASALPRGFIKCQKVLSVQRNSKLPLPLELELKLKRSAARSLIPDLAKGLSF